LDCPSLELIRAHSTFKCSETDAANCRPSYLNPVVNRRISAPPSPFRAAFVDLLSVVLPGLLVAVGPFADHWTPPAEHFTLTARPQCGLAGRENSIATSFKKVENKSVVFSWPVHVKNSLLLHNENERFS